MSTKTSTYIGKLVQIIDTEIGNFKLARNMLSQQTNNRS